MIKYLPDNQYKPTEMNYQLDDMRTKNIESINTAVNVMKHFVELSSKLLPYYEKITREQRVSQKIQAEKEKIAALYDNNKINPESSEVLMNSKILSIIFEGFQTIKNRSTVGEGKVRELLGKFFREYEKLQNNWNSALLN